MTQWIAAPWTTMTTTPMMMLKSTPWPEMRAAAAVEKATTQETLLRLAAKQEAKEKQGKEKLTNQVKAILFVPIATDQATLKILAGIFTQLKRSDGRGKGGKAKRIAGVDEEQAEEEEILGFIELSQWRLIWTVRTTVPVLERFIQRTGGR